MTDELLKYYKALQPFFKEKMGDWQAGDEFAIKSINTITLTVQEDPNAIPDHAIRIPLTIDDINPERGLLGMVKMSKSDCVIIGGIETLVSITIKGVDEIIVADTPTLALLKALCAQKGVEI